MDIARIATTRYTSKAFDPSRKIPAAQIEQYQRAASVIAAKVVNADHRDFLIPCKPADEKAADAACAASFCVK